MKLILLFLYFALGIISALLTVYDKRAAKGKKYRAPESLLLVIALFGGATGMYITMQTIRHKTKKNKFMVGLPLMIMLHMLLFLFV